MIVLEDAPESPSPVRATTSYSKQRQLRQRRRPRATENPAPGGLVDSNFADHLAQWQISDSYDPGITRTRSVCAPSEEATEITYRSKIAAAVMFALAGVTLLGFISAASEASNASQALEDVTVDIRSDDSLQLRRENLLEQAVSLAFANTESTPVAAKPERAIEATVSVSHAIIKELNATRQQANEYLEEINWLHTHNSKLQQKIVDLDSETVALNYELLQLELKVASLEKDTKPQVRVHTIYNFVDVPIGGAIKEADELPAAAENYYKEVQPVSLTQDEQSSVYVADYSGESPHSQLMSEENHGMDPQLRDYGYVYDPETGFYIQK
jgi:hypothetical protein